MDNGSEMFESPTRFYDARYERVAVSVYAPI